MTKMLSATDVQINALRAFQWLARLSSCTDWIAMSTLLVSGSGQPGRCFQACLMLYLFLQSQAFAVKRCSLQSRQAAVDPAQGHSKTHFIRAPD